MIRIVTMVTDESRPEYKALQASNQTPWPLVNVGVQNGAVVPWTSWTGRLRAYCQAAKEAQAAGVALVVFIDGYDVLMQPSCTRQLRAIRDAVVAKDFRVICGVERQAWSLIATKCFTALTQYSTTLPQALCQDMNSSGLKWAQMGVVAGDPGFLHAMFRWILDQGFADDQKGLGAFYNHVGWPTARLDLQRQLVHNVEAFTGASASGTAFLHFPGIATKKGLSYSYNEAVRQVQGMPWGHLHDDSLLLWATALCALIVITTPGRFAA